MYFSIIGHSGCNFELTRDGWLFKYTKEKNYRKRLYEQCKKQQKFYLRYNSLNATNIIIPNVIYQVNDYEKYGFAMEYFIINDFISFLELNHIDDIFIKLKYIIDFIEQNIKLSPKMNISKSIIMNKLIEIKKNIDEKYFDMYSSFFNVVEKEIQLMSDYIFLPIGICHGDLTFSNILVQDENIILIDFLDNFIETPLQDIVKIRQDTNHLWSLNLIQKDCDKIKIKIIMNFIDKYIDDYFNKYSFYKDYYSIFQKINLLRILPYVKNMRIAVYLLGELKKL